MNLLRSFVLSLACLVVLLLPSMAQSPTPEPVTIGVYINNIHKLDLQKNSFTVDYYVWLRWNNPEADPSKTLEYMNAFEVWDRDVAPFTDTPQDQPDGSKYMVARYRGQFSSQMPLTKYPFDSQKLVINFEDNTSPSQALTYVADKAPVTINPEISLSGYVLGKPELIIADHPYTSTFGDLNLKQPAPYSRATLVLPIERPNIVFGIKVLLPIFLVAACGALVFWMHPDLADGRIGLGITSLLTLVALQLTTNDHLPDVDYLLMTDVLFFIAYVFTLACLGQVVRSSWVSHQGETERAIRLDRRAFLILGGLFVLAFAGTMTFMLTR